jgi:hypothetical protein
LSLLLSLLFRQQVATRAENMEILKTKAITIPFECHNYQINHRRAKAEGIGFKQKRIFVVASALAHVAESDAIAFL